MEAVMKRRIGMRRIENGNGIGMRREDGRGRTNCIVSGDG